MNLVIPSSFSDLPYLMLPSRVVVMINWIVRRETGTVTGTVEVPSGDYVAPMVKLLPAPPFDAGGVYPASSAVRCAHGDPRVSYPIVRSLGRRVWKVIWEVEGPVSSQN